MFDIFSESVGMERPMMTSLLQTLELVELSADEMAQGMAHLSHLYGDALHSISTADSLVNDKGGVVADSQQKNTSTKNHIVTKEILDDNRQGLESQHLSDLATKSSSSSENTQDVFAMQAIDSDLSSRLRHSKAQLQHASHAFPTDVSSGTNKLLYEDKNRMLRTSNNECVMGKCSTSMSSTFSMVRCLVVDFGVWGDFIRSLQSTACAENVLVSGGASRVQGSIGFCASASLLTKPEHKNLLCVIVRDAGIFALQVHGNNVWVNLCFFFPPKMRIRAYTHSTFFFRFYVGFPEKYVLS